MFEFRTTYTVLCIKSKARVSILAVENVCMEITLKYLRFAVCCLPFAVLRQTSITSDTLFAIKTKSLTVKSFTYTIY